MSVWPGIWAWGKGSGAVTRRGTRPLIIRTYDVTLSESEESPLLGVKLVQMGDSSLVPRSE